MASSTGQFLAGHRIKRLASASTLPGGGRGESLDEQQVESFWRVEEQHAKKKNDSVATTAVVSSSVVPSGDPSPGKVPEENGQPGTGSEGDGKGKGGTEPLKETVDSPNHECEGDEAEGPEDDVPMGYSPGSTCPTSSMADGSIPVKSNKFDKYYHQSLACKQHCWSFF